MSEPDGMLEVALSSIDKSLFSIRYAPSHLKCPKGCIPTIWVGWSHIHVKEGVWTARSTCYTCSTAWDWVMHPDRPLTDANVVLGLLGDAADEDGEGDTEAPDND